MNPLLISAARFELDPTFHCLQQKGMTPEVFLLGIGALQAAKKASKLLECARGRHVIFIGTCGSFGSFQKLHLVRATDVFWLPTCERVKLSYGVKDASPPIELPEPLSFIKALPQRKVICGPSISLISTLPEPFASEATVENLELYSCASELIQVALSFSVILGVTNAVGADAHNEWRQNYGPSAGLTAEFIGSKINSSIPF